MGEIAFKGHVKGSSVVILGDDASKLWSSGYYGELKDDCLILASFEALYLVERGRLIVYDDGKRLSFQDLLNHFLKEDPDIWIRYLIYSDLRRRGYVVKSGFGGKISFRVYRRGAVVGKEPAKYLVYGSVEGKPIELTSLSEMVREARSARKDLILAIVDRQGEVTYYDVTQVNL